MSAGDILSAVSWYGAIGAAVAAAFLLFGLDRVDQHAKGSYVFRPLLVPGVVVLWPLVLWRWWQLERSSSGDVE